MTGCLGKHHPIEKECHFQTSMTLGSRLSFQVFFCFSASGMGVVSGHVWRACSRLCVHGDARGSAEDGDAHVGFDGFLVGRYRENQTFCIASEMC